MNWLLGLLAAAPCVFATPGAEGRAKLEAAGILLVCDEKELASRETLPTPGITSRAGLASPTRSPWIVSNGWRFQRRPGAKYMYDLPAGKAVLAAAEALAYGADAALKVDPADLGNVGRLFGFLEALPAANLPPIADLAVVDDGSAVTGEVMNLLARRNLLFQIVQSPSTRFRINIRLGSPEYPMADAADPSAFALKIRRQLTDEQRTLRVYGSEVVICRLTGDREKIRLYLINYGGRDIEGLRVRLLGAYRAGMAEVFGLGRVALQDHSVAGGATEFSIPRLTTYAMVDLDAAR